VPHLGARQHRRRPGVTLHRVESTVEGDIDLLGILGLSDEVRNGYQQIRVRFVIEGDAGPEELAALVEQSRRRSAVYEPAFDMLLHEVREFLATDDIAMEGQLH
jgi:hypothetical protein